MAAGAAISLAAHLGLLAALALAVQWRLPAPQPVSAELWSALPQQAGPPAPPEPAVVPAPGVSTAAPPVPPSPPAAPPEAAAAAAKAAQAALVEAARAQQAARQAEIAREREAKRLAEEQQAARERAAQEKAARAERLRQERERTAQQQQKAEQAEKARLQKAQQQKAEQQKAEQQKAEETRLARQREENLRRLLGQIPAGTGTATGAAAADGAPSAGYAGRLVQAIFPNIVFTDTLPGSPAAVVEVRAGPNGTVIGRRLVTSSGHREWDEAVLRAIDRTGTLPRDVDGRVPPVIEITFRPR